MNPFTKSKRTEREKISSVLKYSSVNSSEVCRRTTLQNFGRIYPLFLLILLCFYLPLKVSAQIRKDISLNADWITIADEKSSNTYDGFQEANYNTINWKKVNVPHNWDQYEGYQRKLHGNKHGYAWYRRTFKSNEVKSGKRFFCILKA
jgi:beta-galactosidase